MWMTAEDSGLLSVVPDSCERIWCGFPSLESRTFTAGADHSWCNTSLNRPPGSIHAPTLLTERVIARPLRSFLLGKAAEGLRARHNVQGAAPQSAKPLQRSNQKIPTRKGASL
jgi:hypothetical protein